MRLANNRLIVADYSTSVVGGLVVALVVRLICGGVVSLLMCHFGAVSRQSSRHQALVAFDWLIARLSGAFGQLMRC